MDGGEVVFGMVFICLCLIGVLVRFINWLRRDKDEEM
jgi:hypothetical protein